MKGILIVMVVTFGAGMLTGKLVFRNAVALEPSCSGVMNIPVVPDEYLAPVNSVQLPRPATPTFQCDGRQHCSQMTSKAEAQFFLENCPDTKMDGDHDGDACERQFD